MSAEYMFWNDQKYKDGVRVPLVAYRCLSKHQGTNQSHSCKAVVGHDEGHKCICGESW